MINYNKMTNNEKVDIQELLWTYSNWLHEKGHLDTDYYVEEPNTVDDFIDTILIKNYE